MVQSALRGVGVPCDAIVSAVAKAILKMEKKQKQKQNALVQRKQMVEEQKQKLVEQVAALKRAEALLFECSEDMVDELKQNYEKQKEEKTILEFNLIADMLDTCSDKYAKKAWFMINNQTYRNAM